MSVARQRRLEKSGIYVLTGRFPGEEGFRKGADCGLELTSLMCLRARYFWGRLISAYPGTSFS